MDISTYSGVLVTLRVTWVKYELKRPLFCCKGQKEKHRLVENKELLELQLEVALRRFDSEHKMIHRYVEGSLTKANRRYCSFV